MAWLTGWNYRKPITISNSGSALTDHQILITIDTSTLVTAGKLLLSCNDIRFTSSDGSTTLNYWIESGCNTTSTNIWVKVPSIVTGSNTIYFYYNNPSAIPGSNGTNTFIFFDDFSGDLSKWTLAQTTPGNVSIVGGSLRMYGDDSTYNGNAAASVTNISVGSIIEFRLKYTPGSVGVWGYSNQSFTPWGAGISFLGGEPIRYVRDGTYAYLTSSTAPDFAPCKIILKPTAGYTLYYNNVLQQDDTTWTNPNSANKIVLMQVHAAYSYVDDIKVRKYVATEPTTCIGGEEVSTISWLTGWGRRKSLVITGSTSGTQADYQMKLTVHKSTGTDTSTDIYLGTNVKDDFSDLRFTSSDGSTNINYWIESYVSGSLATVWIKISSIPIGPCTTTAYIYYNNTGASTTSNGTNTFIAYDKGDGVGITWIDNGGTWSNSGGYRKQTNTSSAVYKNTYVNILEDSYVVRAIMKEPSLGTYAWMGLTTEKDGTTDAWMTAMSNYNDNSQVEIVEENIARYGTSAIGFTLIADIEYEMNMLRQPSVQKVSLQQVGSSISWQVQTTRPSRTNKIAGLLGGYSHEVWYREFYVRKYASPEPTISATGTEETEVTPANITATLMTVTPSESPCRTGICTVTADVTWTNTGGTSGTFVPNITIDTITIDPPPYLSQALGAGASVTKSFILSGLTAGTHSICPYPN